MSFGREILHSSDPDSSNSATSNKTTTALLIAASTKDHVMSLAQTDVPNYKVSGTAAASLLFASCVSSLSDCGSATTYFTLCMGLLNTAMFVNQNRDAVRDVAVRGFNTIGTKVANTITSIKESEWVQNKYNSTSQSAHALFNRVQAKVLGNQTGLQTDASNTQKIKKMQ